MNLPRGAKASGWTAGPWMELEPPNYPEGDRVAVHCDKCGAKNRQDPGWRYRDDPPHINTPQRLMLHYQCDRCREDGKRLIYEEVEDDEEEGDDDVDELGDAEAKADEPVDAAAHAGPAAAAVSGSAAGADDVDAAQQLSAPDVEMEAAKTGAGTKRAAPASTGAAADISTTPKRTRSQKQSDKDKDNGPAAK